MADTVHDQVSDKRRGYLSELRLPLLLATLFIFIWVFFSILPRDPILHESISRLLNWNPAVTQNESIQTLRRNDPLLGSALPLPRPLEKTIASERTVTI